ARQLPLVPPGMEIVATAGAGGRGAALEFESFRQIYRELPSVDSVLAAPESARIPDKVAAQYAICSALAAVSNENNFDRVMVYANRLFRSPSRRICRDARHRCSTPRRADLRYASVD
ncbi:ATP-binding protein, partial [Cupriavidus basilensis]